MKDEFRSPWTLQCDSFKRLNQIFDIISLCAWKSGRQKVMKIANITASSSMITSKTNNDAAYHLLTQIKFSYVLQPALADDVLERFFDQTQERSGSNFHIDIRNVTATGKAVNLHSFLPNDLLLVESNDSDCSTGMDLVDDKDLEILHEPAEQNTQSLLDCDDNTLKHKIFYITGNLVQNMESF